MPIDKIVKYKDPFTRIHNQTATDSRLSFGARGLLLYLLSKPEGWKVRRADLVKQSPAGDTVIRRMIKELKTFGYIRQERTNSPKGFQWTTTLYETPEMNPDTPPIDQNGTGGKHTSVKPPYIVTKEEVTKEKTTTCSNRPKIFTTYENNISLLTPIVVDSLNDMIETYSEQWVLDAIEVAVKANKRSIRYINGILKSWDREGKNMGNGSTPDATDKIQAAIAAGTHYLDEHGALRTVQS